MVYGESCAAIKKGCTLCYLYRKRRFDLSLLLSLFSLFSLLSLSVPDAAFRRFKRSRYCDKSQREIQCNIGEGCGVYLSKSSMARRG